MNSFDNYILEGHTPRQVDWETYLAWAKQGFDVTRRVAKTMLGEVQVSTVFLSIDHGFGDGEPILFETMVFGGPHDERQWRYSTWDAAVVGHERIVGALRDGRDPDEGAE